MVVKKIRCKKKMNKKAMALDILLIGIILFVIAIGFLAFNNAFNTAIDQMKENPQINETEQTVEALEVVQNKVLGRLDYIILGLFVGLTLALWITGWLIGGNTIFTFIYFVVIVIATVVASVLSGIWTTVADLTVFAGNLADFPVAMHIIGNLPFYVAVVGLIGLVLTFIKPFAMGDGW